MEKTVVMNQFNDWHPTSVDALLWSDCNTNYQSASYRLPCGLIATEVTAFPRLIFKRTTSKTWVDYVVLDNEHNRALVKEFYGVISTSYYTEEGYGIVEFRHTNDSLKHAFDFFENHKNELQTNDSI